jgi:hypothetical protein
MDKPLSPLSISTLNNLVNDRLLARFSERLGLIDYIRWESDDSQQVAENIRQQQRKFPELKIAPSPAHVFVIAPSCGFCRRRVRLNGGYAARRMQPAAQ